MAKEYECPECHKILASKQFLKKQSIFFPDNMIPICKFCLKEKVDYGKLETMDKFCQYADLPFLPDLWMSIVKQSPKIALEEYVRVLEEDQYHSINWKEINNKWSKLIQSGDPELELDTLREERLLELRRKWNDVGDEPVYSDNDLALLEEKLMGLIHTNAIETPIQVDNAMDIARTILRRSKELMNPKGDVMEAKRLAEVVGKLMQESGFDAQRATNSIGVHDVSSLFQVIVQSGKRDEYRIIVPKDDADLLLEEIIKGTRNVVMGDADIPEDIQRALSDHKLRNKSDPITQEELFEQELESISNDDMFVVPIDDDEDDELVYMDDEE